MVNQLPLPDIIISTGKISYDNLNEFYKKFTEIIKSNSARHFINDFQETEENFTIYRNVMVGCSICKMESIELITFVVDALKEQKNFHVNIVPHPLVKYNYRKLLKFLKTPDHINLSEIGLPFWCQTRIETVTPDKLKLLKEIGCARLSFGIEHGNEEFRKRWLQRSTTNALIINNFKNVKDSGIPFSVNNIVGFPHETRELAFDTIRLNRHVDADDRNAYLYTPFHGTPLRVECEKLGLVKNEDIVQSIVTGESLLDMPQFPKKEVQAIVKTFNMYVKFPESQWPDIKKAEEDSPEGQKIYKELKQEFMDKFFDVKKQAIKGESSNVRKK